MTLLVSECASLFLKFLFLQLDFSSHCSKTPLPYISFRKTIRSWYILQEVFYNPFSSYKCQLSLPLRFALICHEVICAAYTRLYTCPSSSFSSLGGGGLCPIDVYVLYRTEQNALRIVGGKYRRKSTCWNWVPFISSNRSTWHMPLL